MRLSAAALMRLRTKYFFESRGCRHMAVDMYLRRQAYLFIFFGVDFDLLYGNLKLECYALQFSFSSVLQREGDFLFDSLSSRVFRSLFYDAWTR